MRAGLKADPLSWAVTAGVANIGPVDLNDATSVQRRVRTAVAVADRYGTPLTFLTDEEASLYAGTIAKASPQQKVDMTQSIVKQFGRYGRDVLGSISGVDPIFAHAGGLAVSVPGGKETAARIFAGQQAWKDKAVALPSAEAFQAAPGLGQALAFNTKTRSALLSSISHDFGTPLASIRSNVLPSEPSSSRWWPPCAMPSRTTALPLACGAPPCQLPWCCTPWFGTSCGSHIAVT